MLRFSSLALAAAGLAFSAGPSWAQAPDKAEAGPVEAIAAADASARGHRAGLGPHGPSAEEAHVVDARQHQLHAGGRPRALQYAARNRSEMLQKFWRRGVNAVKKGEAEKPHAVVIPEKQDDKKRRARLVNLLREHAIEVHRATSPSW